MFIRSERLFLRPGWAEDWAELLALVDDEAILRNVAGAPWPYSPEDARALAVRPQSLRAPHFVVTLPGATGARLIGTIGLTRDPGLDAELIFWIARHHWNNGYGTEAVRAMADLARTLGHRRIMAGHFIDNGASARVLAKAGFRPTGDFRSRYSMARKAALPWRVHALDLDQCDRPEEQDPLEAMRAA